MEILGVLVFFGLSFSVFSSVPRGDYGEIKVFQSPATYYVESMVMLNDAARKDKEVGYKITANLDVQALWGVDTDFLLKFVLNSPKLHSKGKLVTADYLPIKSFWDTYYQSIFYAHWKNGLIEKAYLNPEDVPDVLNYQKSLISLFQFQVIDGEHNETDISGICDVSYDSVSMQVIRKTKRRCYSPGIEEQMLPEEIVSSKQLIRYSFNEKLDVLEEIHGEEVYTVGHENIGAAIKARAWMRLRRAGAAPATPPRHSSLEVALAQLPAALKPLALPMLLPDEPVEGGLTLEEALREAVGGGQSEEAGGGGDAAGAAAAAAAWRALRGADAGSIAAALRAAPDQRSLAALSRLLGASGSAAAHEAASRELLLAERDAPPPALHYLNALALALEPHESVVADVARLGVEARAPEVREAALLAAAAAAHRLRPRTARPAQQLRDQLTRHLARCVEDECRALHVRALGNLRADDAAEVLLERAEAGGAAALPAVRALAALGGAALGQRQLRQLAALAFRRAPLEVRAAALDLLLVRAAPLPPPLLLASVARALHTHGPPELRRLFWQRAAQLAPEHPLLARVLRMLEPDLRGWHALAHSGTSSVLEREVGALGAEGGARARLLSLQVARGGLLRRGRVALSPQGAPHPLLEIELWTRGLEALAGGGAEGEGADEEAGEGAEEAGGGLELGVGGAWLPGAELFAGQAQLLGHVWAGRGSEPTPVLRAALPLREQAARRALLGAGPLRLAAAYALSLALDAHAQVSLWSRTARAGLELRVGGAGCVRAAVGGLRAALELREEPRLRVDADLDFYERTALCVRAHTAAHARTTNASLSCAPGEGRGVRRARRSATPLPGRTLELGALNSAACRDLAH